MIFGTSPFTGILRTKSHPLQGILEWRRLPCGIFNNNKEEGDNREMLEYPTGQEAEMDRK
jgi:hypothetical protein